MPIMSDSEVRQLATTLQDYEAREEKQRHAEKKRKVEERSRWAKLGGVAAGVGGGALVGFWHGRSEDADGNLFIPRTSIPADFVVGLLATGAAFYAGKGLPGDLALDASNGFLAGATALYFHKHAAAGKAQDKLWGAESELLGPFTHNDPSIGAIPQHYLPVAQSMTDAELAASLRRSL
jgi:hypothetical protein